MKKKQKFLAVLLTALLVLSMAGCTTASSGSQSGDSGSSAPSDSGSGGEAKDIKDIVVGVSIGTTTEERWNREIEMFRAYAEAQGFELLVQDAGNDTTKQISQCENLINQGIDVLICQPLDGEAAAPVVSAAHDAGIKVISYDRFIMKINRGEVGQIYVEGSHPAIISRETFEKTQALRQRKKKRREYPDNVYPLSRKMYCALCGEAIYRRVTKRGTPAWSCRNHLKNAASCPVGPIPESDIYAAFVRMYNKLKLHEGIILKPALGQMDALSDAMQKNNPAMLAVNKAIAEASEQSYRVTTLQTRGLLDAAACAAKLREIEGRLAELRRDRRRRLKNGDLEETIEALRQTADAVHDGPDRLEDFDKTLLTLEYVHREMRAMLYKLICNLSRKYPGFTTELGPFPSFDDKIKFKPSCPDAKFGYIRFGEISKCGHSTNYLFGEPEAGVSCFEAEIMPNGDFRLIRLTPQLRQEAALYLSLPNCPIYRLYGERVGYGWSGDPLLKVEKAEKVSGNMLEGE